ncbi:hypothetical protein PG999_010262 [Apiospora kogelbergensis]|uniref:Uncharacterized protein n=1 Tax=Apiospora kogelbergensis TaxID=1337665 RepID=A0AAW0Q9K0_9PEZI
MISIQRLPHQHDPRLLLRGHGEKRKEDAQLQTRVVPRVSPHVSAPLPPGLEAVVHDPQRPQRRGEVARLGARVRRQRGHAVPLPQVPELHAVALPDAQPVVAERPPPLQQLVGPRRAPVHQHQVAHLLRRLLAARRRRRAPCRAVA